MMDGARKVAGYVRVSQERAAKNGYGLGAQEHIDRALRAAGVDTVFLREGVDTSTPTGELFRNIMASLADF